MLHVAGSYNDWEMLARQEEQGVDERKLKLLKVGRSHSILI